MENISPGRNISSGHNLQIVPWRNIASEHNLLSVKIFRSDIIFRNFYILSWRDIVLGDNLPWTNMDWLYKVSKKYFFHFSLDVILRMYCRECQYQQSKRLLAFSLVFYHSCAMFPPFIKAHFTLPSVLYPILKIVWPRKAHETPPSLSQSAPNC